MLYGLNKSIRKHLVGNIIMTKENDPVSIMGGSIM